MALFLKDGWMDVWLDEWMNGYNAMDGGINEWMDMML